MSNNSTIGTRRHTRIGTMVWGAILVGIAIFAILALRVGIVGTSAVLWSVVGFGSFLLLGAVVTAIVRAATARSNQPAIGTSTDADTSTDTDTRTEHPPIG